MNTAVRIVMIILALLQVLLAAYSAFFGAMAGFYEWWGWFTLLLVHPAAAISLLVLVLRPQPSRTFISATVILLLINVVTDILLSLAILSGIARGDWWLPFIFSVVPVIALPYCLALGRRQ